MDRARASTVDREIGAGRKVAMNDTLLAGSSSRPNPGWCNVCQRFASREDPHRSHAISCRHQYSSFARKCQEKCKGSTIPFADLFDGRQLLQSIRRLNVSGFPYRPVVKPQFVVFKVAKSRMTHWFPRTSTSQFAELPGGCGQCRKSSALYDNPANQRFGRQIAKSADTWMDTLIGLAWRPEELRQLPSGRRSQNFPPDTPFFID